MCTTIQNRKGFHCQELPVVVALVGMIIAIMLPVVQSVRMGVRNGISVQELIGTIVLNLGAGFLTGLCFIVFMFVLFWCVAGFMIVRDYVTRRFRKR